MTCWGLFSLNVVLRGLVSSELFSHWAEAGNADCSVPLPCSCGIALFHAQLLWAIGPSVYLDVEIFLPAIAFFITFSQAFHYSIKQVPWKWARNVGSQYWENCVITMLKKCRKETWGYSCSSTFKAQFSLEKTIFMRWTSNLIKVLKHILCCCIHFTKRVQRSLKIDLIDS